MKRGKLSNSNDRYGWITILLHWSMALVLIGMYILGDYMVELDYYDTWYHKAPALHKEIGVMIALALTFRIIWNITQSKPASLESNPHLITLAKFGHLILYILIILLIVSGYLISTAKGQSIDVFNFFELPAVLANSPDRAEVAGATHAIIGTIFILLTVLHAVAALIHHFVFKDRILKRMLWVGK